MDISQFFENVVLSNKPVEHSTLYQTKALELIILGIFLNNVNMLIKHFFKPVYHILLFQATFPNA